MTLDQSRLDPRSSLDWTEYLAMAISIVVTVALSVWTYRTSKHDDYFLSRVPYGALVMSMIASSSSGVSLLGKPAEAYEYGTNFYVIQTVTIILSTIVSIELFLPILHQLNCASLYEYFELRFHKRVKNLVTILFVITKLCFSSVMVLPPAIVLSHISGVNINLGIFGFNLVTTFYTMLGGFKGVIWTDTLQAVVMFISMAILGLVSIYETGDFTGFLRINYENKRINAPWPSLDPTDRFSIWAYGSFLVSLTSINLNQPVFQRIKCIPTLRHAKMSLWLQNMGMMFFATFSLLVGLSIYAYYFGCDPKEAGLVDSYSQLVVYWVNSVGGRIRGFRGVYLAGIVCASLSSLSTNVNSIACLLEYELRSLNSKHQPSRLVYQRTFTAMVGIGVTVTALVMHGSASLIEASFLSVSCDSIISGLFILGILIVPAEARGALAGGFTTLLLLVALSMSKLLFSVPKVSHANAFMRTDQCPCNLTLQNNYKKANETSEPTTIPYFLRLSPFSIGPIGVVTTVTVGLLVSFICPGKKRNSYDPTLYSGLVHKFLPLHSRALHVQAEDLLSDEKNDSIISKNKNNKPEETQKQ